MTPPDDADADDRRPVSERVVAAVGRRTGEDPTDLDPLYHAVDPEAIDDLFPAAGGATGDPVRQFTFTYEGYTVAVASDGSVDLSPTGTAGPNDRLDSPAATASTGGPDAPD